MKWEWWYKVIQKSDNKSFTIFLILYKLTYADVIIPKELIIETVL